MTTTYKHLMVTTSEDVTTVIFQDSQVLDETKIQETADGLQEVVTSDCQGMIIDFSEVRFMSSSMWGRMVHLLKAWLRLDKGRDRLILCSLRPEVFEVLKITRLVQQFRIAENAEEARAKILKTFQWRNP